MLKSCSNCPRTAQFSLVAIVSSVGVSKRIQKSSPAVLFCDECLQALCEQLCSNALCDGVNRALTRLNELLRERSTAKDQISE